MISRHKGNIPEVIPDGIYGEETTNAVTEFQKNNALPVTGKIDNYTWDAIYEAYKEASEYFGGSHGIYPFIGKDLIYAGFGGYIIYIIQAMINTIAQFYDNIDGVKINGLFDKQTSDQIKLLQDITGCMADGKLDKHTWNCIARLYNHHAAADEAGSIDFTEEDTVEEISEPAVPTVKTIGSVG